jgi:hypothetical protein
MKNRAWNIQRTLTLAATAFIAAAFLVFVSCNKKLGDYNENFIGTWHTEWAPLTTGDSVANEIVIKSNDAAYRYSCETVCAPNLCDCLGQQTGKPVINDGHTLIRIGSKYQPLSLDTEPYQDAQGNWVMQVGGLTYYKQ